MHGAAADRKRSIRTNVLGSKKLSSFKTQALLRRVAATPGPERSFWKAIGALAQEPRPNCGLDLHAGRQPLATDAFVDLVKHEQPVGRGRGDLAGAAGRSEGRGFGGQQR